MARCMMENMCVPNRFLVEVVFTIVYLLNRSPMMAMKQKIPEEAWFGRKPKDLQVTYFGLSSRPCFLWSLLLHCHCGRSIQQVHYCEHCLYPKPVWNTPVLQHASGNLCDSAVSPFNHPILLWSIGCGVLSFYPMFSTKFIEFFGEELSAIIRSKRGNMTTWLVFY